MTNITPLAALMIVHNADRVPCTIAAAMPWARHWRGRWHRDSCVGLSGLAGRAEKAPAGFLGAWRGYPGRYPRWCLLGQIIDI
jgi:hypothetical protein